jgi:hypothetical protein
MSVNENKLLNESLDYKDISGTSTFKSKKLKEDKYFILHHTAGRGTAADVMNILNSRGLGVQWIIDREGKLYKSLPSGAKGAHIKAIRTSVPKDMGNSTTQGVEIIASDDGDILPKQCATALKLVKSLGYQMSEIYGHGEVSTNKQPSEGKTCKSFIRKNWDKQESEVSSQLVSKKDEIDPKDLKLLDMLGIDIKKLKTQFKTELSKVVKDILSKKGPIKEDIDRINDVMKKIL